MDYCPIALCKIILTYESVRILTFFVILYVFVRIIIHILIFNLNKKKLFDFYKKYLIPCMFDCLPLKVVHY